MVFISCVSPSKAKNSHCIGIITESAEVKAFTVSIPSDGGQSIKMKSYLSFNLSKEFFTTCFEFIWTRSISAPAKSTVDGIMSNPVIFVFKITSST